jgi:hypothetical protein
MFGRQYEISYLLSLIRLQQQILTPELNHVGQVASWKKQFNDKRHSIGA